MARRQHMDFSRDRLFEIFDRHHLEGKWRSHSEEEFIFRIVEEYVMELICVGHIPLGYLETIREDLEAEVIDMYRKKTYGQKKPLNRAPRRSSGE
jgi:hypothetical protein